MSSSGPPLWLVGGVVHLFGVVPGARGDGWFTPDVRAALASSDELWVETPPDLDLEGNPLLERLGVQQPSSPAMSAPVAERLEAALRSLGVPPGSLSVLRPWVMVQILDRQRLDRARIDPGNDVEQVLVREALSLGLPVRCEFPGADQAIRFLGEGDQAAQEQYLCWTLDHVAGGDELVDSTFGSWRAGDVAALESRASIDALRYPEMHEWLVVGRNRAWVARIRAMVEAGRRSFVAPGAGHLFGPSSLPDLLAAAGLPAVLLD